MRRKILLFAIVVIVTAFSFGCSKNPPQLNSHNIKRVVAAMTLEEKVRLIVGTGMEGTSGDEAVIGQTKRLVLGAAGTTAPIPRLGIPAIVLADGPAGLRISPTREGDSLTYYCTGFPVATLLACTWNTDLVEQVGEAIGDEVKEYGVDVLLAPALNIHRNPLCGRNFEYYSEDPLLVGQIASAMVSGVQSNGVGTSIKHFAANNQETNRQNNNVIATPRALREIYLRGFEIAVKQAKPWTVMSSYNHINGVYASESHELLSDILRDEWNYEGLVMTDWYGGKDAPAQIEACNDLLMPGVERQYQELIEAVNSGALAIEDLDACVENTLRLIVRSPRFNGYQYSNKPDLKAHAQVTRNSAGEGMVLLKNDEGALPLSEAVKSVALFGVTSYNFIAGGTGSGDVNKAYVVDMRQGLANAGYSIDGALQNYYDNYIATQKELMAQQGKNRGFLQPLTMINEAVPEESILRTAAENSDVAILTIGRSSGEFSDRRVEDFDLSESEIELIDKVADSFHSVGKKVVVVLNIGGVIETASWKESVDAILLAWQAGQEGGNTVADILSGKVNPSGKLSMTFPIAFADHASSANFPIDYMPRRGNQTAENERTDVENVDYTIYAEDVYVGYRYFDTFGKQVSYPFGFGLSYTDFEYSDATINKIRDGYELSLTVTNTGNWAGKEVVEAYAISPLCSAGRPSSELIAFAKTDLLQPGQQQQITMSFTDDNLSWYDDSQTAWVVESGDYTINLAASSRDVRLQLPLNIAKAKVIETTHASLLPQQDVKVLKPAK